MKGTIGPQSVNAQLVQSFAVSAAKVGKDPLVVLLMNGEAYAMPLEMALAVGLALIECRYISNMTREQLDEIRKNLSPIQLVSRLD